MAQRFGTLLGTAPELRPLVSQARDLSALQRHLAAVIPTYLAQGCTVQKLLFGTLTIGAANGTVAAKLRQLAPELVVLLQKRGCEVGTIRIKVQVSVPPPPRPAPRPLSGKARTELDRLSGTLADSPLRQALEKLAKR